MMSLWLHVLTCRTLQEKKRLKRAVVRSQQCHVAKNKRPNSVSFYKTHRLLLSLLSIKLKSQPRTNPFASGLDVRSISIFIDVVVLGVDLARISSGAQVRFLFLCECCAVVLFFW
ncbi:hypothetical protein VNO78_21850 [Psophocarpus tetragonolobus]|uniref:Uncharacterized protein n=1 Tax=Psophocarpus tetragonolobus TaxID=3891 RepID=A0AAN9SBJ6_PSOTE